MINTSKKIKFFFLAHGSPKMALEQNEFTDFLASLGKRYKPKAIIIFTAHWETPITTISSVDGTYDMIYDFYGFPQRMYEMVYPAKGSPELAAQIQKVLQKNGIKSNLDTKRGLDHGSWTLLYKIFPNADIPVIQISVDPDLDPRKQIEIGKALKDLNVDDDVMVIGSGVTVHNLRMLDRRATEEEEWAVEFDNWLIDKITNKDAKSLGNYMALAPYAKKAVPSGDHFAPLLIVFGGCDSTTKPKVLYKGYQYGALSYLSFEIS